jgi:hypothetical protein
VVGLEPDAEHLLVQGIKQSRVRDKPRVASSECGEGISEGGACVKPLIGICREKCGQTLMKLKAKASL